MPTPQPLARRGGGRASAQRGGRDRTVVAQPAGQDYPGHFRVVLVDDGSDDGTRRPPGGPPRTDRNQSGPSTSLRGAALAAGMDRQALGYAAGRATRQAAGAAVDYLLLTDADIGHAPDNLRDARRARRARGSRAGLADGASCPARRWAERFLIPAFVFFFHMLYPFALGRAERAQDRRRRPAAACWCGARRWSGAGGIAAIRVRHHRRLRPGPPSEEARARSGSVSPPRHQPAALWQLAEIGRMVSRSAYAQLGYSPLLLAGTVAGMALIYLIAPRSLALVRRRACAVRRAGCLAAHGAVVPAHAALLSPVAALGPGAAGDRRRLHAFTVQSAFAVWRGRGGMWKGRAQAMTGDA